MIRAHMQNGEGSRGLGSRHQAKKAVSWAEVAQADWPRPAGPAHFRAQSTPFDLAAIQTIYSPVPKSHASTHSSSAAEEQRREGHHLGEERVELID
jgi:hypothetical protein